MRESIEALVSRPISCDSRSTSIRCASSRETRSIRAPMSTVSRISCFSSAVASMKVATMSASAPGASTPWMVASKFGRRLGQELDGFDRLALEMKETGLDLVRRRSGLWNPFRPGDKERPAAQIVVDPEPLLSLTDDMIRAVRRGDVANDIGERSHSMQVDGEGIGDLGVALHHDADRLLFPDRSLRRHHRTGTTEGDRQHRSRKQNHAAHRHDDQGLRRQWGRRRGAEGLFGGGRGVSHSGPPSSPA